jgi:dTDP-4-amino-4,6-dideoxygalactose transaminase
MTGRPNKEQAQQTVAIMRVPFSYLDRQFADVDLYLSDIKKLVETGNFTLGGPLREFERRFAELCGAPYALGVASGTDALILSLKLLGIGPGDEVITTPTTFIATVGAIVMTGARPVFVDSEDGFVIDSAKIEAAITPRTKAIVPVHYTGNVADMPQIMRIARKHNLSVVEDACQAIGATLDGKPVGSWGETACFSLHPLKNLNVWGDGGVIVTRSAELAEKIELYRNHGLINRDEVSVFGCNSRLDTLHAVIGNRLIQQVGFITKQRIANAMRYDAAFADMGEFVRAPRRQPSVQHVFHLYMVRVKRRDELLAYLNRNGIEAKVHYPIPVHLQKAAKYLGYQEGDFPVSEEDSRNIISLPAHQHLTPDEIEHAIQLIQSFYRV